MAQRHMKGSGFTGAHKIARRKVVRRLAVIIPALAIPLAIVAFVGLPQTHAQLAAEAEPDLGAMPQDELSRAAGAGWYLCDVDRTGPGWGNIFLSLECPGITNRWFRARADQKRDMLATGLAAISTQKKVQVYLTGSAAYSEIRACYLKR